MACVTCQQRYIKLSAETPSWLMNIGLANMGLAVESCNLRGRRLAD